MPTIASKTEHYFGGSPEGEKLSPAEVATRFDAFLDKIDHAAETAIPRGWTPATPLFDNGVPTQSAPSNAMDALTKALSAPDLVKGLGADSLASITGALEAAKAQVPDLVKDLNTTNPLTSGLVAYDLEAPAKMLTPRPTPLRNRIPRRKGMGLSHRFKVITGFTGVSGPSPLPLIRPGITETTQNNFAPSGASNSLYYARGPKIAYQGYDVSVPYLQFSLSDEVTWAAQYAGQGFQDIRQLSRTSLLYASMLAEERMLLGGRGTAAGFAGAIPTPAAPTTAARAAAAGETAITGATTNVYVKVTATDVWGQTVLSAATTQAVSAGQVVDVTVTDVTGALGYNIYVSTGAADPGDASRWYAGHTGYNVFTIQGALPTSGTAASTITADSSASALDYDGLLTICTNGTAGQASGYTKRLNAALSTTSPGSEFQTAFAAMYDPAAGGVLADPDRVLMNGRDRKQLSETLKGTNSSNYSMRIAQDEVSGIMLGSIVNTIVNEVTGKHVEVEVHPYLPQGIAPIISDTLPIPDSQVSDCWAAWNVQDLMGVDWTPQQFTFESSSYWFGTFVCYAPQWQGCIQGIKLS